MTKKENFIVLKIAIFIFALLICAFTLFACDFFNDGTTKTYTKNDEELSPTFDQIANSKSYTIYKYGIETTLAQKAYSKWNNSLYYLDFPDGIDSLTTETMRNGSIHIYKEYLNQYLYVLFNKDGNNLYVINKTNFDNEKTDILFYVDEFLSHIQKNDIQYQHASDAEIYITEGTLALNSKNRKLDFYVEIDPGDTTLTVEYKLYQSSQPAIVEDNGFWHFTDFTTSTGIPSMVEDLESNFSDMWLNAPTYVASTNIETTYDKILINLDSPTFNTDFSILPDNATDKRVTLELTGTNIDQYVELHNTTLTAKTATPEVSDLALKIVSCDIPSVYVTIPIVILNSYTLAPKDGDLSLLNQFCNDDIPFTPFVLALSGNQPSATILWKINDNSLSETNSELLITNAIFDQYISPGTNTISAIVTLNGLSKTVSQSLVISNRVVDFSLSVLIPGPWHVNDVIAMRSTIDINDSVDLYIPSQYQYILYKDTIKIAQELITATFQDNIPITSQFLFTIDSAYSDYTIECAPIISSIPSESLKKTYTINKDDIADPTASGIYNTYVDGIDTTSGYAPIIKYNLVGLGSTYKVRIITNRETHDFDSTNPNHSQYFTRYGFIIPSTIASFSDSFDYYVSANEGSQIGPYSYQGKLKNVPTSYFNDTEFGFNGYIENLEEFGALFNYLLICRPENYMTSGVTGLTFLLRLYLDFSYSDIADQFPISNLSNNGNPSIANAENLFKAMMSFYAEASSVNYSVQLEVGVSKGINYTLQFESLDDEDDFTTDFDNETKELPSVMNVNFNSSRSTLPVDSVTHTMSARTADEIYYILINGYRPIPTIGSKADETYTAARNILLTYLTDTMTEAEKTLAIYDALSNHMVYDNILLDISDLPEYAETIRKYDGFSAYGALVNQKAVCDGMSKAFSILLAMEGIQSVKVSGIAGSEDDLQNHAWSVVLLGNEWYLTDITFGNLHLRLDGIKYEVVDHKYLLKSTDDFESTHFSDNPYPPIASSNYNIDYSFTSSDAITFSVSYTIDSSNYSDLPTYFIGYFDNLEEKPDQLIMDVSIITTYAYNSLRNYLQNKNNVPAGYTVKFYTLQSNSDIKYIILTKTAT
ncbi:MAG: hypothetical protein LBF12_03140 [Christensenellaceae bacterium]|jgi:hypothetical protein|nr:hypothetical protein [Christensenellaceae bacterium]